jgi:UDP-N-acetylmuramoylalanine--D-glutamate ligase
MDYRGKKVLVMGLGLHGGGLESACYFLKKGAEVTVTDLKDEKTLSSAIGKLEDTRTGLKCPPVRYVLGRHETGDFENADIVVKNPGVRRNSPFLKCARQIETDISVFLARSPARLFAVTGSKGKSGVSSALCRILSLAHNLSGSGKAALGGNITVSPLSFLNELAPVDDVVLELSSWQLADLRGRLRPDSSRPEPLLKPKAAVITAIMPDHMNYYSSMEEYVNDKRVIYQGQDQDDITIAGNTEWGRSFTGESRGRPVLYGDAPIDGESCGWVDNSGAGLACLQGNFPGAGDIVELVPSSIRAAKHERQNLLAAALAAYSAGVEPAVIREALLSYQGLEHRLELFHKVEGIEFYNDSAATVPEASAAAVEALSGRPLVLVAGGSDKNLDFSPLVTAAQSASSLILLSGSGSEKLKGLLDKARIGYSGPFDCIDAAARRAIEEAKKFCKETGSCNVALSPGCTSFEMFDNEFDRGRKWKEACLRLL